MIRISRHPGLSPGVHVTSTALCPLCVVLWKCRWITPPLLPINLSSLILSRSLQRIRRQRAAFCSILGDLGIRPENLLLAVQVIYRSTETPLIQLSSTVSVTDLLNSKTGGDFDLIAFDPRLVLSVEVIILSSSHPLIWTHFIVVLRLRFRLVVSQMLHRDSLPLARIQCRRATVTSMLWVSCGLVAVCYQHSVQRMGRMSQST